jgi:hypothetical protein
MTQPRISHGATRSTAARARRVRIDPHTLHDPLPSGWSVAEALSTPMHQHDHDLPPRPMQWCPRHEVAWCCAPAYGTPC